MPTAVEQLTKLQEQILETIASFQKPIVETVERVAERAEGSVPEAPSLPYGEHLPSADELLEANFGFVEKLVVQQKDFAKALFAAARPVSAKVIVTEPKTKAQAPKAAKAA